MRIHGTVLVLEEMTTDCIEIHDLIPAYCLGATDPDETKLVEAHLGACPNAAAEVADYLALSEALLYSAPVVAAPAGLANKLVAATSVAASPASVAPSSQSRLQEKGPTLWQRFVATLAGAGARPLPVLAAIALVALLAVNVYLMTQVGGLRGSLDDLESRLGQQVAVLTQVGEGTNVRIGLPAGPAGVVTAAYGAIVCSPEESQGFLLAENMPVLDSGEAYQVWLGQGDQVISVGLFEADGAGYGKLVFTAPLPMGQYDSVRVTAEPATGSVGPTSAPTIGGSLYGADYPS